MGNRADLYRSDSLETRSKLIDHDRLSRAPVGITEHAESLYLKPVHRDGRQARDGDGLFNRGCRNRRPLAGCRSVHYRITDEVRLCPRYPFDRGDDLAGIRAEIQETERRHGDRLGSGLSSWLRGKTTFREDHRIVVGLVL